MFKFLAGDLHLPSTLFDQFSSKSHQDTIEITDRTQLQTSPAFPGVTHTKARSFAPCNIQPRDPYQKNMRQLLPWADQMEM